MNPLYLELSHLDFRNRILWLYSKPNSLVTLKHKKYPKTSGNCGCRKIEDIRSKRFQLVFRFLLRIQQHPLNNITD